jgi:hypothetical protein
MLKSGELGRRGAGRGSGGSASAASVQKRGWRRLTCSENEDTIAMAVRNLFSIRFWVVDIVGRKGQRASRRWREGRVAINWTGLRVFSNGGVKTLDSVGEATTQEWWRRCLDGGDAQIPQRDLCKTEATTTVRKAGCRRVVSEEVGGMP